MQGLSDKAQAWMVVISSILIALGPLSFVYSNNMALSVGLAICGAIGFGIKEAFGGKAKATSPTV